MRGKEKISRPGARVKRAGIPLTVYLPEEQAADLNEVCKARHVTKATLVRFAMDQLFDQLRNGQLTLPLGLSTKETSSK
jgi:hypothetical protein